MECGEKVLETPSGTPESSATGLFQRQWRVYRKVVDNNYLFHREALFAGKRVRIFAHDDCSGYGGAATWAATLKAAGAVVDSFGFTGFLQSDGCPVGDLNDFACIDPDQWETERTLIESAFDFVPANLPPPLKHMPKGVFNPKEYAPPARWRPDKRPQWI